MISELNCKIIEIRRCKKRAWEKDCISRILGLIETVKLRHSLQRYIPRLWWQWKIGGWVGKDSLRDEESSGKDRHASKLRNVNKTWTIAVTIWKRAEWIEAKSFNRISWRAKILSSTEWWYNKELRESDISTGEELELIITILRIEQ